jgi:hypothetical protein
VRDNDPGFSGKLKSLTQTRKGRKGETGSAWSKDSFFAFFVATFASLREASLLDPFRTEPLSIQKVCLKH